MWWLWQTILVSTSVNLLDFLHAVVVVQEQPVIITAIVNGDTGRKKILQRNET